MLIPGHITKKQMLKEMKIPNFNYMTIDKMLTFANNIPYMDRETALKALSEFPNFIELEKEFINLMRYNLDQAYKSNQESMAEYYRTCNRELDYCYSRLNSDSITKEERAKLEERLVDIRMQMYNKDTENKQHWLSIFKEIGPYFAIGIAGAASILGVVSQLRLPSDNSEDEEENNSD